jgi:hypothetical protein
MVYFFLLRVVNILIGQLWLLHRMLIFCALNVLQQTVTSGTSQLDVLSLPAVNIIWGSFGWDEHIWRRKKTLVSFPSVMFFQSWQQRKTFRTFS